MIETSNIALQLNDIQSGVLRPRPSPYAATYVLLRIDDRKGGRELLRRLSAIVASAAHPESPASETWMSVALTAHGLKALGLPQESLDSFPWEFRQGMRARAKALGDTGESSPENWEQPLGTSDVPVVINLGRQFEFVQSEWINGGDFLGLGDVTDPVAGLGGGGVFGIPQRPIPKRLQGLPRFVVTRGGEYCFMPGLRALRGLAELDT